MRAVFFVALGLGLGALAALPACSSDPSGGAASGDGGSGSGATCPSAMPVAAAGGDAGSSCATCLESGCFGQLAAYRSATAEACAAAAGALASCAQTTCGPACGGSVGVTTLDAGGSLSAACQTYVSCCIAANSAALLDAGVSLASIEISCEQNASVSTDSQCATATAELLDAGVVCH